MTLGQYACDDCEYAYEGPGGLGLRISGHGWQTVWCADCARLHDVPVRVDTGGGTLAAQIAAMRFACRWMPPTTPRPGRTGSPG